MKNLFEKEAMDEVIGRIDSLRPAAQRQWGKMDVAQMLAHCSGVLDMASGKLNPPRILIGRIIGSFVKPIYTNEKPFSPNSPTDKKLIINTAIRLVDMQPASAKAMVLAPSFNEPAVSAKVPTV